MRVLGIDPGTRHLGWGVVEQNGTRLVHIAHGVVSTDATQPLAQRLVTIDESLLRVLDELKPSVAAVETLFYAKDPQSAAKLGHARGVVLLRMARAGLDLFEYEPTKVKRSVVGRGAADKRQVALVVCQLLGLTADMRHDASDALAVALTHLQIARFDAALAKSGLPPAPRRRTRTPGRRRRG